MSALLIVIGVAVVWAIAQNTGRVEATLIGVGAMIVGVLLASLIIESRRGLVRQREIRRRRDR